MRVAGLTETELNIELYNVTGQRIMSKHLVNVSTVVTERIETSVPAGVYYLRVNDGVNNATLRVVMQ